MNVQSLNLFATRYNIVMLVKVTMNSSLRKEKHLQSVVDCLVEDRDEKKNEIR